VIARTDRAIGVHKAPANEELTDVLALATNLTDEDQGPLNEQGINCIRAFARHGIRVWGARTVSDRNAWQYINVRRVITTAVRWIERNMADVVFESHTEELWARIERDLTVYFTKLLEQGALAGRSSQGAFYIKCNAETNPPEEREVGRLVTEIGLTPVVPTEFIIIRIIHGPTGARIVEP
jgi:phage tail sheath protein FI